MILWMSQPTKFLFALEMLTTFLTIDDKNNILEKLKNIIFLLKQTELQYFE